jgi:hypothetical protein
MFAAEDVLGDLIESVDDVVVMESGESQYDPRPGIIDIGVSHSGVQVEKTVGQEMWWDPGSMKFAIERGFTGGVIKATIAEITAPSQLDERVGDKPTLIFLFLSAAKKLHGPKLFRGYIFPEVQLIANEIEVPWRGEATSCPVAWAFKSCRILDYREEKR